MSASEHTSSNLTKDIPDPDKFTDKIVHKISHPHMYTLITENGDITENCRAYASFFAFSVKNSLSIKNAETFHRNDLPESHRIYTNDYYTGLMVLSVDDVANAIMLIDCFIQSWNSFYNRSMILSKNSSSLRNLKSEFSAFCSTLYYESGCEAAYKWDCHCYQEYREDDDSNLDNTNLAEYYDKIIRRHVKSLPVPMLDLPPLTEELKQQTLEFSKISMSDTMFITPLVQGLHKVNTAGLKILMGAEFRASKNRWPIRPEASFIHTFEDMPKFFPKSSASICDETSFLTRLTKFVGNFLPELDLSNSYITGSTIPACLRDDNNYISRKVKFENQDNRIMRNDIAFRWMEVLYPVIYTEFKEECKFDFELPRVNPDEMVINITSAETGVCIIKDKTYDFQIVPAVDVDLAVDSELSDEEYFATVQSHISCIRKHYPFVKVQETKMPKGSINYRVYTDDPDHITTFRQVEIYRTTFSSICCHHVGVVRGAFTSKWSSTPRLYLTSSAVYTYISSQTPNYNYFASRKNTAQDVILKYMQRGFSMDDQILDEIISEYTKAQKIKVDKFAFYKSRGLKFNLLAAATEWMLMNVPNFKY